MGHIPEKLAIPKDHLENYNISINDIAKDLTFADMIISEAWGRLSICGRLAICLTS
jgi:hypothetical protein